MCIVRPPEVSQPIPEPISDIEPQVAEKLDLERRQRERLRAGYSGTVLTSGLEPAESRRRKPVLLGGRD